MALAKAKGDISYSRLDQQMVLGVRMHLGEVALNTLNPNQKTHNAVI